MRTHRLQSMFYITVMVLIGCSDAGFVGASGKGGKKENPQLNPQQPPPQNSNQQFLPGNNSPNPNVQFGSGSQTEENLPECFDRSNKTAASSIRVRGENWPNNTVDPGGADFNDYYVDISGKFLIQGQWEIFSAEDQEITVNYSLGSPGSTTQVVKIHVVDCNGVDQGSFTVSQGSGTQTLSASAGERFNLFTTATTAGHVREFDLIKDKDAAYRVDMGQ